MKDEYTVKITDVSEITHNVRQFRLEKPGDYSFTPGQATEVSVNKEGWKEEERPFTFTCLPEDDYLEFTIKIYPSHEGVTREIGHLEKGDEFIIREPWGAINYEGEGVFIAGGAGVTPFIAIFRQLRKEGKIGGNKLIFANNTSKDIILKDEFSEMLEEDNFINILDKEENDDYYHGFVDRDFLEQHVDDFDKMFYVCGPPPMMKSVLSALSDLDVSDDKIVKEDL